MRKVGGGHESKLEFAKLACCICTILEVGHSKEYLLEWYAQARQMVQGSKGRETASHMQIQSTPKATQAAQQMHRTGPQEGPWCCAKVRAVWPTCSRSGTACSRAPAAWALGPTACTAAEAAPSLPCAGPCSIIQHPHALAKTAATAASAAFTVPARAAAAVMFSKSAAHCSAAAVQLQRRPQQHEHRAPRPVVIAGLGLRFMWAPRAPPTRLPKHEGAVVLHLHHLTDLQAQRLTTTTTTASGWLRVAGGGGVATRAAF